MGLLARWARRSRLNAARRPPRKKLLGAHLGMGGLVYAIWGGVGLSGWDSKFILWSETPRCSPGYEHMRLHPRPPTHSSSCRDAASVCPQAAPGPSPWPASPPCAPSTPSRTTAAASSPQPRPLRSRSPSTPDDSSQSSHQHRPSQVPMVFQQDQCPPVHRRDSGCCGATVRCGQRARARSCGCLPCLL